MKTKENQGKMREKIYSQVRYTSANVVRWSLSQNEQDLYIAEKVYLLIITSWLYMIPTNQIKKTDSNMKYWPTWKIDLSWNDFIMWKTKYRTFKLAHLCRNWLPFFLQQNVVTDQSKSTRPILKSHFVVNKQSPNVPVTSNE